MIFFKKGGSSKKMKGRKEQEGEKRGNDRGRREEIGGKYANKRKGGV